MASENESEKRETLADIIAEMRTRSREVKEAFGGRPDGVENMLDIWADRIEAIDSADAWRSLYTPGNAAKMRETIEWLKERLTAAVYDGSFDVHEALDKIDAALSAPARQCDVGTAGAQMERFREFCKTEKCKRYRCRSGCKATCIDKCAIAWAQTPYAEKGDGDGE